ncbi:MAG TPA: hypothetical protein PKC28_06050 [Bdellovibrionales bacterium]|nr:hypothetical protein [Bdellovibrionales bacterium]
MRLSHRLLILAFVVTAPLARAADRRALVETAYRMLPITLRYAVEVKELPPTWTELDKKILARVNTVASWNPPLAFSDRPQDFRLLPHEPTRLMRYEDGTVHVNLELLNRDDLDLELPTLFKLLFHELGHAIGVPNWGERDHTAQHFENLLRPYTRTQKIGAGEIVTFSLPIEKIETMLGADWKRTSMPTTAVFFATQGHYFDLTESVESAARDILNMARPLSSEFNRVAYGIGTNFGKIPAALMEALMTSPQLYGLIRALTGENPEFDFKVQESLRRLRFELHELRTLEVASIEATELEDSYFVHLKAAFRTSRTAKNIRVNFGNVQENAEMTLPLSIHMALPRAPEKLLERARIQVTPRARSNYATEARVSGLIRAAGEGGVSQFSVDLPLGTPEKIMLAVQSGAGYIHVPLSSTENTRNSLRARFAVPPSIRNSPRALLVEAVLIDNTDLVELDRVVQLSPETSRLGMPDPRLHEKDLVPENVGLWGRFNGVQVFKTDFDYKEPSIILDQANGEHFILDHNNLLVEFRLPADVKIREVRLHLQRMLLIVNETDKEGREVHEGPVDGENLRFASGGNLEEMRDFFDILVNSSDQVFRADLEEGRQIVRTKFQARFRKPRELEANEAYGPPLGNPVMLEIVTSDLQTIRHYFGDAAKMKFDCPDFLNPEP